MSQEIDNIHDAFFKRVLSDPMLAGAFLREHLPPEVAGLLGPEPLEPVPGSFVDEELRQHHSDLLFRVQLKSKRGAFAYILMEHKSSPDQGARLQLLRYVVRVLARWYDQNDKRLPLPPVLPLLAHQGPEGWEISCESMDLFGTVSESLRPYLPSFRHALVDLAPIDDHMLSTDVRLRAFLKALKYRRRPDLDDCVGIVLADVLELEDEDLFVILTYLETGRTARSNKAVHEALDRLAPERKERILGPLSQPYYEKGLAEGEARGEARGEAKGEIRGEARGEIKGQAKILTLLLERRFGALPESYRRRILTADINAIEAWAKRVFDAPDLQTIFESN